MYSAGVSAGGDAPTPPMLLETHPTVTPTTEREAASFKPGNREGSRQLNLQKVVSENPNDTRQPQSSVEGRHSLEGSQPIGNAPRREANYILGSIPWPTKPRKSAPPRESAGQRKAEKGAPTREIGVAAAIMMAGRTGTGHQKRQGFQKW